MKPLLAVTMGDPSGVGPEILARAFQKPSVRKKARFLVFGDLRRLEKGRKALKGKSIFPFVPAGLSPSGRGGIPVVDFRNVSPSSPWGRVSPECGKAAGDYLGKAVRFVMENDGAGLVTLPINKVSIRTGLWKKKDFGHTEYLARITQSAQTRLMMVKGPFRVVHVTSHMPLSKVSRSMSRKKILETIQLAHSGCRMLGFLRPRIAVCALNPHGGEAGLFGHEEARFILPAIKAARKKGIRATGPFPADSLWPKVKAGNFDGVVAMYHDQGQIPIKLAGMEAVGRTGLFRTTGVNMTLGLPFVRVSVAHGTAFDIAGKGRASDASFIEAIDLACAVLKRGKNGKS